MKLMIMGHGRHGKDTVCEVLRDRYSFTFASSSWVAAENFIYQVTKDVMGYQTIEECFNDRHNHRALWKELITAYNHLDKARLSRDIFRDHDIYAGIRDRNELQAAREAELFDYAVWVDAGLRMPEESTSSCTVTRRDADYVLDNNEDLGQLERNIGQMMLDLMIPEKAKEARREH